MTNNNTIYSNNTPTTQKDMNMSNTTTTISTDVSIFSDAARKKQLEAMTREAEIAGGMAVQQEKMIRDHAENFILKPETMTTKQHLKFVARQAEAEAEIWSFTKVFNKTRPADGAVAVRRVMQDRLGESAAGKSTYSMFGGASRPEMKTVCVGILPNGSKLEIEVPWGLMQFEPWDASFTLKHHVDHDYGHCFAIEVQAPMERKVAIMGLFTWIEEYLQENSIYRGKAIYGVGRANRSTGEIIDPDFINIYKSDRTKIVYTERVTRELQYSTFGVIENADALRKAGLPIGEKILLWGPNGSGKTEAATAAMQIAVEQGWTAIRARWDEDLEKVVKFAENVGGPAVVVVEDVEKLMVPAADDERAMDRLLDLFDGASAKGREVMLIMTSNHVHELSKSMTRPGRIDRLINVANLDREAFERLFNILVRPERLKDIDFDTLFEAFPEVSPVWVVAAVNRAEKAVIIRTGEPGVEFVTDDFIYEAEGLMDHVDLHMSATDRPAKETFGELFSVLVEDAVEKILGRHEVGQGRDLKITKIDSNA